MTYRIAMVGACPYPVPQGSQVLLRNTALALRDRGHDVRLVVYGYGVGDDESGLEIRRAGTVPGARKTGAGPSLAKPFLDIALLRTLKRVVREDRIDVVHAHNYEALAVALASGFRPVVYHAHNALADELPHFFPKAVPSAAAGRWADRTFPKRADAVIVLHNRMREYLVANGCDANKTFVVPPAIETHRFEAGPPTWSDSPAVVYTGNLDRYQNLSFLEAVWRNVRAEAPKAALKIATAAGRSYPWAVTVRCDTFSDLQRMLSDDVVVVCPRVSWSGFPMKIANAMAAGRPVVACQSAAHGLIDGENALVVPDDDTAGFARAIVSLMADRELRHRIGEAARNYAQTNFRLDRTAQSIEAVYDSVKRTAGR